MSRATQPRDNSQTYSPASSPEYDVIVLGAGISGLVSASILVSQGNRRVLVLDEYEHLGGNHIDCAHGEFTFDVGNFIFQDDSPLLRHFPEILACYVPIEPTFGRLNPQGKVTQYPFSMRDDLLAAGPLEIARIFLSVAYARVFHRRLTDARSFARYWIGERLLVRAGLENYLERFYGVEPEQIDLHFAYKRMLWIREHAMLRTHLQRAFQRLKRGRPAGPPNTQLVRPRAGFSALYQPAKERLEAAGVTFTLGVRLASITQEDSGVRIYTSDGRAFSAARVVSTIPVTRAQALCGLPREDSALETVTLISLFYSFAGERRFPQSVLFNFSHAGAWKRLTMHSDFYDRADGREYFGVEVNADHVAGSAKRADEDFRRHVRENNLFAGDLRLEGSHRLESAYPIYTHHAAERAARAIAALRRHGIESFGRQGGFDYQPTARVSTGQAETSLTPASE